MHRFLVMPSLEGTTLRARLSTGELLDVPTALWIVRQVAEALDALEAAGWVHGDVKPENIFVSSEGHATLLDLGFARRSDEAAQTAERGVMGTAAYLAPERLAAPAEADIRGDIYSLGAVLFESLAGRPAFEGDTLADLLRRQRQSAPPNLLKLVPQLPPDAAWLVRRMLAKDPLRRPQTPRGTDPRAHRLGNRHVFRACDGLSTAGVIIRRRWLARRFAPCPFRLETTS